MGLYETGEVIHLDEMHPDELLQTFDESVAALGPFEAFYGGSQSDALAIIHMCEAQYAVAHQLKLPEQEIVAWSGLRQALGQRVDGINATIATDIEGVVAWAKSRQK